MELKINLTKECKAKPQGELKFGSVFTDHMFLMEYRSGAWQNAQILPYQPLSLSPSAAVFHYGQAVFEGAKAFKNPQGEVRIFRPEENIKRLLSSCERACIPSFDAEFVLKALKKLIQIESEWIPDGEGKSLYIRPFIIATEESLSVHAAREYLFYIILSPVGAYYSGGLSPVKLFVEQHYTRAAKGGTGSHKIAGNYAASLKAGEEAVKAGFDQVMWLDSATHEYVEEVGSMNIMFVINDEVVTPALNGSILPGITRKSVIELLSFKGIKVAERAVKISEIIDGLKNGSVTEIFGTGTAAVISPVGMIQYGDKIYNVPSPSGKIALMLYDELTGIQTGRIADNFGWVTKI